MDYQNYPAPTEVSDIFQEEIISYASFWERFFAVLIGGTILIIPAYLSQIVIGDMAGRLISIAIYWLYFASMESGGDSQATVGKKAIGIKVQSLTGERLIFGQATGRFFGKYLSTVILLIGYLMMMWDDKKQALHDKMAGTGVIKNKTTW